MSGVWLEDLTWTEAKARFDADAVVICRSARRRRRMARTCRSRPMR